MTQFSGRKVLITGAASGIGRRIAGRAAEKGAKLILLDLNAAALEQARKELQDDGHACAIYRCDLSDKHQIAQTAREVLADHNHIDILINNAGIVSGKTLLESQDEDIERTFAVNTLALFRMTRAFLPGMTDAGGGHIVTIASAGGIAGTARLVDYCSSKFAAIGFDESLRLELKRLGIPVKTTVVCPYYIDTGMFEGVKTRFSWLLPILDPGKVTEKILRAIERDRARLIMPWFVYTVYPMRIFPVSWQDAILSFLGINRSMDEFKGRRAEARNPE